MTVRMFELQLLGEDGEVSGVMPLVGELTLGQSPDADWPLASATHPAALLHLTVVDGKVVLRPERGFVRLADGAALAARTAFRLPVAFSLCGQRFRIVDLAATAAPAVRPDEAPASTFEHLLQREEAPGPEVVPQLRSGSTKTSTSGRHRRVVVAAGCAALCVVAAVVQWAATSVDSIASERLVMTPTGATRQSGPPTLYAGPPLVASVPSGRTDPDQALLRQLQAMVRQAGVGPEVDATLSEGRLALVGEAEPADVARLERMARRFATQHEVAAGVGFKVEAVESELPFVVRQVIGGAEPFIVLDSGERLGVGERIDGYTLVAIEKSRLVFQGRRRITVDW